jgi:hypothetical protein
VKVNVRFEPGTPSPRQNEAYLRFWQIQLQKLADKNEKAPEPSRATEAIAGLVKLTNHTGRGYSFKAIRAKLLYSNLPTFHRPVFDRSLEVRPPFTTLGEIKDYGVKFSTLYEMLWEV